MFALSSSAVLVHWLANAVPCELGAHIVLLGFGGDAMLDDNEKATSRVQWPSCSLSVPCESGAPSRCRELGAILY